MTLFILGVFGILIQVLLKIQTVNRRTKGNFKLMPFLRLEWPSIFISLCLVVVCLIARYEVVQLKQVGNYLGLAFVAIGYMSQSIIYHFFGKAEKRFKSDEEKEE